MAYAIEERALAEHGTLVEVRGELDVAAVPDLRRALETVTADRAGPVVIDLNGVSFIDSLSIASIVAARRRLGDARRGAVVATHPYVLLIFEAGGLDAVVPVFDSREEAVAHVHG
jgi:anti-anti-sigma factor